MTVDPPGRYYEVLLVLSIHLLTKITYKYKYSQDMVYTVSLGVKTRQYEINKVDIISFRRYSTTSYGRCC